jgi:hypothetical protein
MNNFLNETVKASMPQQNSTRIPLSYTHKRERDTFHEVQASDLPPIIRQNLNPRHKPKVRVTTDQRTGEVLAKIVKCRVADIDVCSPRTTVDWRVSVNLEMEYPGDVSTLPLADAAGRGERIKDRMSYSHLAYQVDLTQVAKSEVSAPKVPMLPRKHENSLLTTNSNNRARMSLSMSSRLKSLPLKSVARVNLPWQATQRTSMRTLSRGLWTTSACWLELCHLDEVACIL